MGIIQSDVSKKSHDRIINQYNSGMRISEIAEGAKLPESRIELGILSWYQDVLWYQEESLKQKALSEKKELYGKDASLTQEDRNVYYPYIEALASHCQDLKNHYFLPSIDD